MFELQEQRYFQCVAVGRRLTVLQWKHNVAWTTWCASADTDTVDGFLLLKELNASEPPSIVTIIESSELGNEWVLCCGLRHNFELISANGTSRILHLEGTIKPHLIAALDLCEDDEPEVLLCYNSKYICPLLSISFSHRARFSLFIFLSKSNLCISISIDRNIVIKKDIKEKKVL